MNSLSFYQVHKSYSEIQVLRGLDLRVGEGEVYGFLGRNGAGKSTALRAVMGINRIDAGRIELFGEPVLASDPLPRRYVGYVAQEQHFYDWMTAPRAGRFVGSFYPDWDAQEFARLLARLEVPTDRRIRAFSGGMTAKLALALALAARPRLLVLDEPTAGMDAVARREFIDIVRAQAREDGRTTVFSSHLIDEVERAASQVGIIEAGVARFEGSLDALRGAVQQFHSSRALTGREPSAAITDLFGAAAARVTVLADETHDGTRTLTLETPPGLPPARPVFGWQPVALSLEDRFVALVGNSG
ncbi:MAG: ABC transporter ATP-binding protein [Pseudomonadota bacterium]